MQILTQEVWGGTSESAFLTSSQQLLLIATTRSCEI